MDKVRLLTIELFYVLTGALVIFSLIELTWERIVLSYINLNYVLILWMLNVMVLLLLTSNKNDE